MRFKLAYGFNGGLYKSTANNLLNIHYDINHRNQFIPTLFLSIV